jgi:hypothetical protein
MKSRQTVDTERAIHASFLPLDPLHAANVEARALRFADESLSKPGDVSGRKGGSLDLNRCERSDPFILSSI